MLEIHRRYLPFGTSGVLIFISGSQSNSRTDMSVLSEEITKKEIGTVCFISSNLSIDTDTVDSIDPSVTVLSILIPPDPEANDSVYDAFLKIQKFLKRGNLLFLIASDCEARFPFFLSKLLLAASPSLSDSELQDQISHFGYSTSEQTAFRKYLVRRKEHASFQEVPPGESSVSVHLVRESKRNSTLKYKIEYEPGVENLTQIKAIPYSEEERKNLISSFRSSPIQAIEIDHFDETQKLKEIPVLASAERSQIGKEETQAPSVPTQNSPEPLQVEESPVTSIQPAQTTVLGEPDISAKSTSSEIDKKNLDAAQESSKQVVAAEVEKNKNVSTVKSKFPLQIKLMAVISILMTFTVSTIIFFASSAFRDDSEVRVLQNNLNLVNILGLKIKTDIKEILSNGKQIVGALVQGKEGISFADIFFQNDPDFIYAGLYEIEGNVPSAVNEFYNDPYLSELKVSPKEISDLVQSRPGLIQKSVLTGGRMENLSAEFKEPIFAIAIPSSGSNSKVLVLILRLEKFLNAFQKQDISEIFLVNGEGDLIAHSDPKLLQSNTNFMNLPIVESMVKSSENTKQIEYKNKEGQVWFGSYQKLGFGGAAVVSIVPEDKAFETVYKIQRTNLLIMGIALCLALIIVFFFAKTITKPVLHLLQATTEIAQGNFKIKIRSTTKDEVGLLTDYFVDMGKGLEEREKVKDALGRFVNKEIAEMVLKHELTLGGERKMCAIFFSDIRSFTSISEKLQPEEVVEFLNEYMTEMIHCVNETHGIVDKFIGDAIMATWGAAKTSDKDAENSVNGALMMRAALLKFNQGRGGDKKPIIKIGCGLNYGPVIAGQIGSEQRLEYTVIGDAVNLASRVEALNKPFGTDILITQDLLDHVPGIFNVEKMQSIKVKGKEEPQVIYAVLGRIDDPTCPKNIEELRAKIGIVWEPPKKDKTKDSEPGEEVKYEILD
ncbi:adenylate/guanylate cyclase catalytic domain protein [Leptospira alstonii serovar Pingchang str. 80-412]|uniref:Adenylate/guanylate cyclase catalytic domain protein n=2 Tax=Leptospira alstonii TaxID=28452 RepID=M6CMZ2_9LEPT|nr:adenylate/guanylate cyclase domain-containing protein [Leptospira alstonii]EMJ93317.1 adenylate/guanylate cyclase catalytic domain protein [Leptospira alstonii serovar Sichuan str. 79601]EQA82166.1 adenylate/guanylate cyclase catalytic domain protein [Leptospira alstonii serovar Pingchang str. 80-412]